jgi:hypothetical protein
MVYLMSVHNIFSPVASRIVRVLLVNPKQEWSILGLSKEARTGYGHTFRVVKTLLRMSLCRQTETNRVVVANPGELLTRWAGYYDFSLLNKVNAYYSLETDLDGFIRRLSATGEHGLRYALTLQAGASSVTPYVRPVNVHLYVDPEKLDSWQEFLRLQLTELGGNIFLVEPYDEGVFYNVQRVRGINVVSNVQLYVDLYNYPARGREAAEHLRKEVIGF